MTFPLSQNSDTRVFLLLFNAAIVAAQSWLGDIAWWIPVVNWGITALFALVIQHFIQRLRLGNVRQGIPFAIAWILLTTTTDFASLYLAGNMSQGLILLQMAGLLAILSLMLTSWQMHDVPVTYLTSGAVVGVLTMIYAPTVFWLLMLALSPFYMRSSTARNFWCAVTGTVFGIWVVYFVCYFFISEIRAAEIIGNLLHVFEFTFSLPAFSLQAWIFIAVIATLLIVYTGTSFLLNVGDSLRTTSCIQLLSALGILFAVFTALNIPQLVLYVSLLSLLLSIQVTLHHANLSSPVHEWWVILILAVLMLLGILPILIPLML